MKILVTVLAILLASGANGCEFHRRLERQRLAAQNRLSALGQEELRIAQDKAYEDVRQSIYNDRNQHHGEQELLPYSSSLPANSKYCGNSREYYCDNKATCVRDRSGVWKCRYESKVTLNQPVRPHITTTSDRTYYGGGRYWPRRPVYGRDPYIPHVRYTKYTCGEGLRRVDTTSTSFRCDDIDECADNDTSCDQKCVNTYGSFYCLCERGYRREGETRCVDKDECEDNPGLCQFDCVNTEGSYHCQCPAGYNKGVWNTCSDINECETQNQCEDTEICFNLLGSFECTLPHPCPEGYFRSKRTGADLNENCLLEDAATASYDVPGSISYRKILVPAHKYATFDRPLSTMTFSSTSYRFKHHFTIRVLEGGENFTYRRRNMPHSDRLVIDIYNRKRLEPNVRLPYVLMVTDTPTLKYPRYYRDQTTRLMPSRRKVSMTMIPMNIGKEY